MLVDLQRVRKCHYSQGGVITAVDGVDLTLPPGSFTLLHGPSGSGKSTLLALIGGFARPTSGVVTHDGIPIGRVGSGRSGEISWVMQEPIFIPELTVRENLFLPAAGRGGEWPEKRGEELLEVLGLTDLYDLYPSTLSGGERRRLSVARGLLLPARLLLLDEPLAYLDGDWGGRVMELVRESVGSSLTTLVVATHQPLPGCERARVIRMERGKVSEDDGGYH